MASFMTRCRYINTLEICDFPVTFEDMQSITNIAWQNNVTIFDSMHYLDMEQYLEEMNDMQKNSNKQPTMVGTKKGLIAFYNGAKELPSFAKLFCNIESINEDHVCVNNGFNGEDSIPFFRRISWTDISENASHAIWVEMRLTGERVVCCAPLGILVHICYL